MNRASAAAATKEAVIMEQVCDVCKLEGKAEPAKAAYDGKTKMGPWAYMCEAHFKTHGVGLGTGKGQKL